MGCYYRGNIVVRHLWKKEGTRGQNMFGFVDGGAVLAYSGYLNIRAWHTCNWRLIQSLLSGWRQAQGRRCRFLWDPGTLALALLRLALVTLDLR